MNPKNYKNKSHSVKFTHLVVSHYFNNSLVYIIIFSKTINKIYVCLLKYADSVEEN